MRDRGKRSDTLLRLQEVLDAHKGEPLDAAEVWKEVERLRAMQRSKRSKEIGDEWHNTAGGKVVLAFIALAGLMSVYAAFDLLTYSGFEIFARAIVLCSGLLGSVALLIEDPFHEGIDPKTPYWCRLKVQGKLVGISAVVAALATGLSFYTSEQQQKQYQDETHREIKTAAAGTIERLESLTDTADDLLTRLEAADREFTSLRDSLASLERKSDEIRTGLDTEVVGLLENTVKQKDLVTVAKTSDLGGLAKTTDLGALAKTSELSGLAKTSDLSGLAKTSDLTGLAKTSDLTGLAKTSDFTGLAKRDELQACVLPPKSVIGGTDDKGGTPPKEEEKQREPDRSTGGPDPG